MAVAAGTSIRGVVPRTESPNRTAHIEKEGFGHDSRPQTARMPASGACASAACLKQQTAAHAAGLHSSSARVVEILVWEGTGGLVQQNEDCSYQPNCRGAPERWCGPTASRRVMTAGQRNSRLMASRTCEQTACAGPVVAAPGLMTARFRRKSPRCPQQTAGEIRSPMKAMKSASHPATATQRCFRWTKLRQDIKTAGKKRTTCAECEGQPRTPERANNRLAQPGRASSSRSP